MGHVGSSLALERRGMCSAYATRQQGSWKQLCSDLNPKARSAAGVGEAVLVCTTDLSPAPTWKRGPADHELWRSLIQKNMRWDHSLQNVFPLGWRQSREAGREDWRPLLPFSSLPSSSLQRTQALLAWSFLGLLPSSLLGWGFLPCCPSEPSLHLWQKSPVPRISSPFPQSWDYLIPPWASLVWLCFPLWSHSVLLEQQVNQHVVEVILHCRISGNTMYVNVEALFLQNLFCYVPAVTLVLHHLANLYEEQLPVLQGGLSSAPLSTWYGTAWIR